VAHLQPALHRAHRSQARRHIRQRRPGTGGGGRGRQRIAHVVASRQRHRQLHLAERTVQPEAGREVAPVDLEAQRRSVKVGLLPEAEAHHPRHGSAAPQRGVGIVGVDDGDAADRQPGDHLPFRTRRALQRTETFQVFRAGVGDQADPGPRHLHQLLHVAAPVGTHLDHRAQVAVVQPQQRHRHTQVIVQVAAGGQARPALRQDRGDHLFHRGLAIAAGHSDHRSLELRACGARRIGERHLDTGYHDLRQRQLNRTRHNGAGGAGGGRCRHEVVAVGMLTAQRREQVAGFETAAVDRDFVEASILPLEPSMARGGELLQRADHRLARPASNCSTTAASLNGRRSLPTIW